MLARVTQTESTPPLWYTLGWLVHRAGGPLRDVRLLSVAAGCGLAAVVGVAGRRVLTFPGALVAGLLVALGDEFVAHGHELRAYEVLALLTALFVWLLLRELDSPSRKNETALALVVAAGALTHYFFALPALTALIWLSFDSTAKPIRRSVCLAIGAGGTLAAVWAPVMLAQYHRDRFWWIGPFSLREVVAVPTRLFTMTLANTPSGLALSAIGFALVCVGCVGLLRIGARGRLIVVLAFGPLVGGAGLWAVGVHVFALRNLIEVGPAIALVAGSLVDGVAARGGVIAATVAGSVALLLPFGAARPPAPPFGAIAHALVAEG